MIKCLFLVYRAANLSRDEFFDYWERVHSRMAVQSAPVMRMRRYVQNHRRDHAVAQGFQAARRCQVGEFDGVAEAWWDSFDDMLAAAVATPPELAAAILADEARFVDLERSVIWFGEEKPFYPAGA